MLKKIENLLQKAISSLKKEGLLLFDDEKIIIDIPNNQFYGNYSTNVAFILAKKNKKKPIEIAEMIVDILKNDKISNNYFEKIEIVNGFINFSLSQDILIDNLKEILEKKENYAKKEKIGKTVIIDYSSPNIAKPFGIGHLRSTIIGQAIYNIYQFLGWDCVGDNHLGDWGTQFGKLIVAIEKWNKKELTDLTIQDLENLYVKFHQKAKKNPELLDQARENFKKLEQGDKEIKKIWEICVKTSLREFDKIYKLLDVKIDYALGESFYQPMLKEVVEEAINKGVAQKSKGALIIRYSKDILPPAMILKSDGSTTYFTRDLAAVKYRLKRWKPDLIIYEVGVDQILAFKQLFQALSLLGWTTDKTKLKHIAHSFYRAKDGKFSTRRGKTVYLEEVLEKGINLAKEIIKNKDIDEAEKEKIANIIGMGAIKYNDLSQHYSKEIIFDWDKILNLQGNSAPYIQYTIVRCISILEKNNVEYKKFNNINLSKFKVEELTLLNNFFSFQEVVNEAGLNFSPNLIANYLYETAKKYNVFYENCSILKAENDKKNLRLALTTATKEILTSGLLLLGIKTVNKM